MWKHAITRNLPGEIDEETIVDEPLKIIAQAFRKHAATDKPCEHDPPVFMTGVWYQKSRYLI